MKQKVIPIIRDSCSSKNDDTQSNKSFKSFKKCNLPKLDFSRESSFNYPKPSKEKRGESFNSRVYDDAIIEEEPELK